MLAVASPAWALREAAAAKILGDVGVLVLVDQDVSEAAVVFGQHVRMFAEQADVFQQQVAEIGGVQRLQPLLIGGVELAALAVGETRRLRPAAPARASGRGSSSCRSCRRAARRPALLVDVFGLRATA